MFGDNPEVILPPSQHFTIQRLADGVYAAIATTDGDAFSNAGIIDLGDSTLIFDTFETPWAAADLQAAAEQLTGRLVTYVINSHIHLDHWLGNNVYQPETVIVATRKTRALMPEQAGYMKQLQSDPGKLNQDIAIMQQRLEGETDPRWRLTWDTVLTKMRRRLGVLPELDPRLPDEGFEGRLAFYGLWRRAELVEAGAGHTASDAYLVLPAQRVAFIGDLGFFQTQPALGDSDPTAWKKVLLELENSDIETFVPGHGPVGTKADLALEREYIQVLEGIVAGVVARRGCVEDALQQALPPPFDGWLAGEMNRFEHNVRVLFRLSSSPVASAEAAAA